MPQTEARFVRSFTALSAASLFYNPIFREAFFVPIGTAEIHGNAQHDICLSLLFISRFGEAFEQRLAGIYEGSAVRLAELLFSLLFLRFQRFILSA